MLADVLGGGEMAMASERVDGVVEHLLDALEVHQPQCAGLGRVEAVRLLAVHAGQAPRDRIRREPPREQGDEVTAAQHRRVADVPPVGAGGLVRQDVAPRHVVDVDVPHPPVHRELNRLSCNHRSSVRLIGHPFINLACILLTKVQSRQSRAACS